LKKYKRYKKTNVEWIGEIPEDWSVLRIKDFTYVKGRIGWQGLRSDEFTENTDWYCVTGTDFQNGRIDWENCYCIEKDRFEQDKKIQLRINDLLITKDGTIGKIALIVALPKKTTLNSGVFITRPFRKAYMNEYMFWLLSSTVFRNYIDFTKNGSTILHLYQNVFERFIFCVPSPKEQIVISNYLYYKISAIDKKILLLERKNIYYKELSKSLINEAVCRGLKKNVPLKESGNEWIGKIPKHWEIRRVKDSYNLFSGNSISDKGLFENKTNSIDYVSTKDIDVETGEINYDNGVYIPKENKGFKIAKANSTLICVEGANAGKKIGFSNKEVCFVNKLCSIKSSNKRNFDKYFYFFTKSTIFEKQFFSILNGLIGGVSLSSIKFFDIISPTIDEQKEIANYLDTKTKTINAIIKNITTQIVALKELRKSVINDIVTGKLKVSE